jgi:hypothetical protein
MGKALIEVLAALLVTIGPAAFAGVGCATAAEAGLSEEAKRVAEEYSQWISEEQEWIVGTQLAEGPFPTANRVVPYFANFATYALLLSPEDGAKYGQAVRKHLEWYLSKLERPDRFGVRGTVYDYELSWTGKLESKEDYDSSDSYGATFFSALLRYYKATGDRGFVVNHRAELEEIAGAVLATQTSDGLTWAKVNYRMKYLMDNAEVYRGLLDLAELYREAVSDEERAVHYEAEAARVRDAIEKKMWQSDHYTLALDAAGRALPFNGKNWYPDATSQLFPIWLGVIDQRSEKAVQIYHLFNANQPGWVELEKEDPFPWAQVGYTAALVGDFERADAYVRAVRRRYIEAGWRNWPWHPAEASFYVLTLDLLRQAVEKGEWQPARTR